MTMKILCECDMSRNNNKAGLSETKTLHIESWAIQWFRIILTLERKLQDLLFDIGVSIICWWWWTVDIINAA